MGPFLYLVQATVTFLRRRRGPSDGGEPAVDRAPEPVLVGSGAGKPWAAAEGPSGPSGTPHGSEEPDPGSVLVATADEDEAEPVVAHPVRKEITMLVWLVPMYIASYYVGIGIAGVGFAVVYLLFACREKLWTLVPVVAIISVLYWYVFVHELKVVLPVPYFQFTTS